LCLLALIRGWYDRPWNISFSSIWQENEITREEMVKKMIIIVGEKLLLETLKKLHYCVSFLYCFLP
jgi:hypothetical protein